MSLKHEFIGEFIGTFILVLFGCSSVAASIVFGAFNSLLEVALIWGIGVTLAIFVSSIFGSSHLNPAVSFAMWVHGNLPFKKLPIFISAQLIGALFAGIVVYLLFSGTIAEYEQTNSIIRGTTESQKTAMIFGEFFPNPAMKNKISLFPWQGVLIEGFGTFLLVFTIFSLTERQKDNSNSTPFLIGLTVTLIICLIAPFTQAGLNPARDFGPRLVAYFSGWNDVAFPSADWSFLTVYILSPICGGIIASILFKILTKKLV